MTFPIEKLPKYLKEKFDETLNFIKKTDFIKARTALKEPLVFYKENEYELPQEFIDAYKNILTLEILQENKQQS